MDVELTETEILEEEAEEASAVELNVCSLADAKNHLQEVCHYFESCSFTSDVEFLIVSQLENSFLKNVSHRQPSIRDFFH